MNITERLLALFRETIATLETVGELADEFFNAFRGTDFIARICY